MDDDDGPSEGGRGSSGREERWAKGNGRGREGKGKKRKKQGGERSEAKPEGTGMREDLHEIWARQTKGHRRAGAVGAAQGNLGGHCGTPLAAESGGNRPRSVLHDWLTRSCSGLRAAEQTRTPQVVRSAVAPWLPAAAPGCQAPSDVPSLHSDGPCCAAGAAETAPIRGRLPEAQPTAAAGFFHPIGDPATRLCQPFPPPSRAHGLPLRCTLRLTQPGEPGQHLVPPTRQLAQEKS